MLKENYNPSYSKAPVYIPVRTGTICRQMARIVRESKAMMLQEGRTDTPNQLGENYWYVELNNLQYYGTGGEHFNSGIGDGHDGFLKMLKGGAPAMEIGVYAGLYGDCNSETIRAEEQEKALAWWASQGNPFAGYPTGNMTDYAQIVWMAKEAGVFDGWESPFLNAVLDALNGKRVKGCGKYYAKGITDDDWFFIGG